MQPAAVRKDGIDQRSDQVHSAPRGLKHAFDQVTDRSAVRIVLVSSETPCRAMNTRRRLESVAHIALGYLGDELSGSPVERRRILHGARGHQQVTSRQPGREPGPGGRSMNIIPSANAPSVVVLHAAEPVALPVTPGTSLYRPPWAPQPTSASGCRSTLRRHGPNRGTCSATSLPVTARSSPPRPGCS